MDTPQVTADDLGDAVDRLLATAPTPCSAPPRRWLLGPRGAAPARRARAGRPDVACRHRCAAAGPAPVERPAGPAARDAPRRRPRRRRAAGRREAPGTALRGHACRSALSGRCRMMGALYSGALRDGHRLEAVYPDGTRVRPCPSSTGAGRCSPATPPCSTAAPARPSTSAVARGGSPLRSAARVCPRSASTSTRTPYASPGPRAPAWPAARSSARAPAGSVGHRAARRREHRHRRPPGRPAAPGRRAAVAQRPGPGRGRGPGREEQPHPAAAGQRRSRLADLPLGAPRPARRRRCRGPGRAATEESWQAAGRWFVALRHVQRPTETDRR